jgi:hypothetical protein
MVLNTHAAFSLLICTLCMALCLAKGELVAKMDLAVVRRFNRARHPDSK